MAGWRRKASESIKLDQFLPLTRSWPHSKLSTGHYRLGLTLPRNNCRLISTPLSRSGSCWGWGQGWLESGNLSEILIAGSPYNKY